MSQKAAPHLAISADLRTVEDVHAAMLASYRAMPFSPSLVEGLRAYFASAADTPGPHLVHCMAGKDRTGLAVAMLHKATGVHVDDMMADYLLTNTVSDAEARIAAGARVVRKTFPHIKDEGVRALMNVDAAYLNAAFDAIRDRYDSFADYLGDILGVDADQRKQLVGRLVG